MAATKPSREPLVGDGLLTDLPLRRTTLSLLLATGVFAGSHVAEAGAATRPADATKARLGDVPLRTDPVDTVLTISLSDDDVSGLDDAELAARRLRREARTERALRIAALWQQRRVAKAHESAARGRRCPIRRRRRASRRAMRGPHDPPTRWHCRQFHRQTRLNQHRPPRRIGPRRSGGPKPGCGPGLAP